MDGGDLLHVSVYSYQKKGRAFREKCGHLRGEATSYHSVNMCEPIIREGETAKLTNYNGWSENGSYETGNDSTRERERETVMMLKHSQP